jgi:hypothetical protein
MNHSDTSPWLLNFNVKGDRGQEGVKKLAKDMSLLSDSQKNTSGQPSRAKAVPDSRPGTSNTFNEFFSS